MDGSLTLIAHSLGAAERVEDAIGALPPNIGDGLFVTAGRMDHAILTLSRKATEAWRASLHSDSFAMGRLAASPDQEVKIYHCGIHIPEGLTHGSLPKDVGSLTLAWCDGSDRADPFLPCAGAEEPNRFFTDGHYPWVCLRSDTTPAPVRAGWRRYVIPLVRRSALKMATLGSEPKVRMRIVAGVRASGAHGAAEALRKVLSETSGERHELEFVRVTGNDDIELFRPITASLLATIGGMWRSRATLRDSHVLTIRTMLVQSIDADNVHDESCTTAPPSTPFHVPTLVAGNDLARRVREFEVTRARVHRASWLADKPPTWKETDVGLVIEPGNTLTRTLHDSGRRRIILGYDRIVDDVAFQIACLHELVISASSFAISECFDLYGTHDDRLWKHFSEIAATCVIQQERSLDVPAYIQAIWHDAELDSARVARMIGARCFESAVVGQISEVPDITWVQAVGMARDEVFRALGEQKTNVRTMLGRISVLDLTRSIIFGHATWVHDGWPSPQRRDEYVSAVSLSWWRLVMLVRKLRGIDADVPSRPEGDTREGNLSSGGVFGPSVFLSPGAALHIALRAAEKAPVSDARSDQIYDYVTKLQRLDSEQPDERPLSYTAHPEAVGDRLRRAPFACAHEVAIAEALLSTEWQGEIPDDLVSALGFRAKAELHPFHRPVEDAAGRRADHWGGEVLTRFEDNSGQTLRFPVVHQRVVGIGFEPDPGGFSALCLLRRTVFELKCLEAIAQGIPLSVARGSPVSFNLSPTLLGALPGEWWTTLGPMIIAACNAVASAVRARGAVPVVELTEGSVRMPRVKTEPRSIAETAYVRLEELLAGLSGGELGLAIDDQFAQGTDTLRLETLVRMAAGFQLAPIMVKVDHEVVRAVGDFPPYPLVVHGPDSLDRARNAFMRTLQMAELSAGTLRNTPLKVHEVVFEGFSGWPDFAALPADVARYRTEFRELVLQAVLSMSCDSRPILLQGGD